MNEPGPEVTGSVWRAYVDESESNRALDPDTYLLAAALVDEDRAAQLREVMSRLRPRGHSKLHWQAESDRSRKLITAQVAQTAALHVVVVRSGRAGESSERRRRKCLQRLAYELAARGVREVTAEARERKVNLREQAYFNQLRAAHQVEAGMRLYHVAGPAEPLLWLADAVAGAVVAARTGTPDYLAQLAGLVDIVSIDTEV